MKFSIEICALQNVWINIDSTLFYKPDVWQQTTYLFSIYNKVIGFKQVDGRF